jgi:hypothetical protein
MKRIFSFLIRNDTAKSVKFNDKTEKPSQTHVWQGLFSFYTEGVIK